MMSLPPWVCFILSFFVNIIGIALIVIYFANSSTRSPQRGMAAVWGLVASFALGMGFLLLTFVLGGHR